MASTDPFSMNPGWFGVPPSGGWNCLDRLKPGLQAVRGLWSQCAASKSWGLPMNRLVAQAFQPAGLPDFRVRWTRNGRLESRPNPQARKPALRTRLGSWSQCARHMAWRLPMNRSAELQPGAVWRAPNAPTWRSALQARGSKVPMRGTKSWRLFGSADYLSHFAAPPRTESQQPGKPSHHWKQQPDSAGFHRQVRK